MKYLVFALKAVMTFIIGQTLFFKFSGAEESVYIFSTLGVEPWGRIALGSLELLSIVLLWIRYTSLAALVLILGMMTGAIASHVFILGYEIMGDGGELFLLAVVTWISSAFLLYQRKQEVKGLFGRWIKNV